MLLLALSSAQYCEAWSSLAGSRGQRLRGCEQIYRPFDMFGSGHSKVDLPGVDPPEINAIDHLDVGAGAVRWHTVLCQGIDSRLSRNRNAGDRLVESLSRTAATSFEE
jgi:hypothetical protein